MDQERIGKIIKENRIKNNMTQADLADKVGVTYQAVSKWENGKNIPDIAILTEISKLFNLDINELLGNNSAKKKSNIKYIIIVIVLFIITTGLIILKFNHKETFKMTEIKSTCEQYDINGVVAYNKNKTSIYISNVNYCGKKDEKKYKKITCNLYEKLDDKTIKIKSCSSKTNTTLEEYLKDVKINVDNYKRMCTKFNTKSLYLEIETDEGNGVNTHKVPLKLEDKCN